jgi:photosystem II stability/assembly factor-like uncharacterized protein
MAQGTSREPAFRDNFYDVVVRDQYAWGVGYYGTILHSSDRGATWTVQNSTTSEALFRIVFLDRAMGWASGGYGTLLHTRDGGKSWQKQTTNTEEHLLGLQFLDSRLGWAVGSRGIILRTEDGGINWASGSVGEDIILNDVRFLDSKKGWAVGEFGRIYRTQDGGRTWTKHKSPIEVDFVSGESRNLFRLLFDRATGWAFGLDGSILKTQGGERWEVAGSDGAAPRNGIRYHLFSAASFNGTRWAVGERGTLLVSASSDHRWKRAAVKVPPLSLNGIAFGADGFGLIVGNRGLILRTDNGGESWQLIGIVPNAPGKGVARPR